MPDDPTPLGDAMSHRFTDQKIPEPKPGRARADDDKRAADISQRPALPDRPRPMAADTEDEESDPVDDGDPGIADRMKSLKKQQG